MQFFSNVHNHKHSPPAHTSYIWHLSNTPHFHKFVYSVHTLHWVVCFLLSNGELALQTAVVNKLILNKCIWQKVPPPPPGKVTNEFPFPNMNMISCLQLLNFSQNSYIHANQYFASILVRLQLFEH